MSILETARDTLAELQISEVLRERLSLALDQLVSTDKKLGTTLEENADLKAELKIARRDLKSQLDELGALREAHKEEVRILRAVEFRRGPRTGEKWLPFCPKCHCPALSMKPGWNIQCSDTNCGWNGGTTEHELLSNLGPLST